MQTWYNPAWYDPPTGLPVGATAQQIVETGFPTLVSFPWYLSSNGSAGPSFESLYLQDVTSNKTCVTDPEGRFECTCYGRLCDLEEGCYEVRKEDLHGVLGGEAALWGEMVDAANLQAALWMPAAVVAERLWSPRTTATTEEAWLRLVAMQRHMATRGFPDTSLPPRASAERADGTPAGIHLDVTRVL